MALYDGLGVYLSAAPQAEFRLKPGTNTCMVRNANLVNGHLGATPVAGDPAKWAEIFAPDRDCTVCHLTVGRVRVRAADGTETPWQNPDALVRLIEQTPNPDYPKTTPKGGTGKGIWLR